MTLKSADDGAGQRIRARRLFLGMSQRRAADLAGISHSTLSRIEGGELSANNRFVLASLARVLHCHVDFLTGVMVPGGKDAAEVSTAVYDAVHTILTCDLEFAPRPAHPLRPAAELAGRVDDIVTMRKACDFTTLVRRLPLLVTALYDATTGPDRAQALDGLVRVNEAASFAVRFTGDPRAATICSDRARQAAQLLGDPVLSAFGEWARAHSALGCGLHDRTEQIANKAIADLDGCGDAPGRLEMLGMLYLTSAFASVGAGRRGDGEAAMDEARQLAARTGETDTFGLMFGPLNVRLWEVAEIADGGDPLDAVPIIADTNVLAIDSLSRQSAFFVDAGRVFQSLGHLDKAVQMLETAERIAPQRVHGDPFVVEAVRGLLETVRRQATTTRLRGLAARVGVAS